MDAKILRGVYPEKLLREWDQFDDRKGSENERPDHFAEDQLFVVLVYSFGGSDLENAKLNDATKGVSILKQVIVALALAEKESQFEHRDLHWGNILVRECEEKFVEFDRCCGGGGIRLETNGISVSVIDFSLSRMTTTNNGEKIFFDLNSDPELFNGDAAEDFQFEVYRTMRTISGGNWHEFHPKTNVAWLEYLADKLIHFPYTNKRSKKHKEAVKRIKTEILPLMRVCDSTEELMQKIL